MVQAVHPASQEWIMQRMMPGSLMTHIDFKPLSDYGNTDQEVWSKVQQRMSAEGLQHITVTFECRGLQGETKKVLNVYAVNNMNSVNSVKPDGSCRCELCKY